MTRAFCCTALVRLWHIDAESEWAMECAPGAGQVEVSDLTG